MFLKVKFAENWVITHNTSNTICTILLCPLISVVHVISSTKAKAWLLRWQSGSFPPGCPWFESLLWILLRICFILTSGTPPVNRIDLRALTLVGPTVTRLVLDPLAVISLDNRLCIYIICNQGLENVI